MRIHDENMERFLSRRNMFVIPVYQREYQWKKHNCRRLFDDLVRISGTKDKHFLGIICFHSINSDELSIIDGQQRITSLSLLLLAIRNSIEDDRIQEEIKGDYILYYDRGNRKLLPKLKLCQKDAEIYNALVEKNEENLTEKQKNRGSIPIINCFVICCQIIRIMVERLSNFTKHWEIYRVFSWRQRRMKILRRSLNLSIQLDWN